MPPRTDVIRRLREKGQAIRLFGETDLDSFKRLNQIEINESNEIGMRNDFKMAMEKSEQESLNEIMNSASGPSEAEKDAQANIDVRVKDDEINFNEILVPCFFFYTTCRFFFC
jgi:pre-mRNA-splicing factor 18